MQIGARGRWKQYSKFIIRCLAWIIKFKPNSDEMTILLKRMPNDRRCKKMGKYLVALLKIFRKEEYRKDFLNGNIYANSIDFLRIVSNDINEVIFNTLKTVTNEKQFQFYYVIQFNDEQCKLQNNDIDY